MWFDSHCHLHLCDEGGSLEDILGRAAVAGVTGMVTIGIDAASSELSVDIAERHGVFASVGVHPNDSTGWSGRDAAALETLLKHDRVVAVGESGLDFYRDSAPEADQRKAFIDHIELASRHDKALVIHTRSSIDRAMDVLDEVGAPERFVFHCWSGDGPQLERALAMGAYVSFAGNVSFKNAPELREAAARVPD